MVDTWYLVWVGVDCIGLWLKDKITLIESERNKRKGEGLWLKVKEIKEKEKDFDLDRKNIVFNWKYFWKLKLVLNER